MMLRTIPRTGEKLPVIGFGTWQVFDVSPGGGDKQLSEVLQTLYDAGGRLIDSSPMYGKAEETVGRLTESSPHKNEFFYATKVWTTGREEGIRQMDQSVKLMGRTTLDLMQIHNLVDWRTHLQTLKKWKEEGQVRYIGMTHYTDAYHEELEKLIVTGDFDFVQFNYSLFSRHAEKRLLDAAAHHGVATLINRPFGEGAHINRVKDKPLPTWAADYGIESWGALLLKYIISHPAVTCVIPATSKPQHAADNMRAAEGDVLDERGRKKMQEWASSMI